jgi:hypothetical protein
MSVDTCTEQTIVHRSNPGRVVRHLRPLGVYDVISAGAECMVGVRLKQCKHRLSGMCDVISAVAECMVSVRLKQCKHRLSGVCDVISAVAECMVSVRLKECKHRLSVLRNDVCCQLVSNWTPERHAIGHTYGSACMQSKG